MTGEDLYDQYRSVLEQRDCGVDPWHDLDDTDQSGWNELAKRVALPLDQRENAAVLAGLRLLQLELCHKDEGGWFGDDLKDIYTDGGNFEGLDPDEIDDLCERLNVA